MVITRKRRILIAALAVVGILFVGGLRRAGDGPDFYRFLARHPYAVTMARLVFKLTGEPDQFEWNLAMAEVEEASL